MHIIKAAVRSYTLTYNEELNCTYLNNKIFEVKPFLFLADKTTVKLLKVKMYLSGSSCGDSMPISSKITQVKRDKYIKFSFFTVCR